MEKRTDWLSLTAFALSLLGVLGGLLATLGLLALLLANMAMGAGGNGLSITWAAASLAAGSLLGIPMAYWTGRKVFLGKLPDRNRPPAAWAAIALLFPLAIGGGFLASEKGILPGVLGPMAQVLAAGIPAALIALTVRRASQAVTPTRAWGHFLMGLWASPILALALEAALLVLVVIILVLGLAAQPDMAELLLGLGMSPALPQAELDERLTTLLLNPWTIGIILAYIAVLVPMLEEAIKVLGLAPFLRLPLTPSEAYLGGVLSGLGYALFEALFLPQPGSGWAETMLARVGATLMHAFTAGWVGWALAELTVRRRAGPILLAYPGAVAVHGIWNASAVAVGLAVIAADAANSQPTSPPYSIVSAVAGAMLVALTIGAITGIAVASRRLGRAPATPGPTGVAEALPSTPLSS